MKLGTETNSIVNHLYSRMTKTAPYPEIGMGATLLSYTDRRPATIYNVFEKGKFLYVHVKNDKYERIDNNEMSESQEYKFTTCTAGLGYYFRFEEKNGWVKVYKNPNTGRFKKCKSQKGLLIGRREKYHDFSF